MLLQFSSCGFDGLSTSFKSLCSVNSCLRLSCHIYHIMATLASATMQIPATGPQPATDIFPFLRLPPELRNIIYAYAFQREEVKEIRFRSRKGKQRTYLRTRCFIGPAVRPVAGWLSLLHTCRQIAYEAAPFLHGNVKVSVVSVRTIASLLDTPQMTSNLKYIQMHYDTISELGNGQVKLARLPKLRQLSLSGYHYLSKVSKDPSHSVRQYAEMIWRKVKKFVFAYAVHHPVGSASMSLLQFDRSHLNWRALDRGSPDFGLSFAWSAKEMQVFEKELEEYIEAAEKAVREALRK